MAASGVEHPDFPVSDWQDEVTDGDTRLGYWEWVALRISAENVRALLNS